MNFAHRTQCHRCNKPREDFSSDDIAGPLRANGKNVADKSKDVQGNEIQDGLQLSVVYKTVPSLEDSQKSLSGLHSIDSKSSRDDVAHILLFTSLESLEAAKVKLDSDKNVKSTDYMGMRSAEYQVKKIL